MSKTLAHFWSMLMKYPPKCLEFLMIEAHRYLNGLSPQITNDIFKLWKNTNDLRNIHLFETKSPETKRYGLDCIVHIISQIWQTFLIEIRDSILRKVFKQKIKTLYCNSCPCYCCKPYNHHLGFV